MTGEPIRPIALFLPSVRGGGAERVVLNLAQGVSERGLPVDLVLATPDGPLRDQLSPRVRAIDLHGARTRESVRPLIRYLRRERPRVLISQMSHANLIALWAARLAGQGTPVVVTEHNTMSKAAGESALTRRLWPVALRWCYRSAAGVVAVSRGAADDFARTSGFPRDRVDVIYNPVITPAMLAQAQRVPDHPWLASAEPPLVIAVGRLTAQKDFPTLLRAFAAVLPRRRARLLILGEGVDRPSLERLVTSLGIGEHVALPGFRTDAIAYMARAALFVLSSAWEGLPTVLIEALAVGTRVVSTDCPSGPREILQGGRLGALVPVGDASAMADAIVRALEHPGLPPDQGLLAPFTLDAAVDNYLHLIERVGLPATNGAARGMAGPR